MKSALILAPLTLVGQASAASAQEHDADELSKKLANPVSSLISVPFQSNFDFGAGPDGDGFSYFMQVQPVIPITLNEDWNLISRTILPIAYADYAPDGQRVGAGRHPAEFFLSPSKPGPGGLIWGLGPVIQLPTSTDDFFGSNEWGLGPTGVALVQKDSGRSACWPTRFGRLAAMTMPLTSNQTFLQPFVQYHSAMAGAVPQHRIHLRLGRRAVDGADQFRVYQVMKLGRQPVQLQFGGRYYAEKPEDGPDWGLRADFTLLFPKK